MTIRSLLGSFDFRVQQFFDPSQEAYLTWFDLVGQFEKGYVSEGLREHSTWLVLSCSYQNASDILSRQTGEAVLSDQGIRNIVVGKAQAISSKQEESVKNILSQPLELRVNCEVDLYDPEAKEILLSEDGILVKGQKEKRKSKNHPHVGDADKGKRWNTDMASLQLPDGTFTLFTNDLGGEVPLSNCIRAKVLENYGQAAEPLNIVAITDGARSIHCDLLAAFGCLVACILDWYHLCKKVNERLSMIAYGKQHKEALLKQILALCWKGEVKQAINIVEKIEKPRNAAMHQDLINYLTKHQHAIINYEKRKAAGKTIGSGFMESAVNEAIGKRQKAKSKSWRPMGSKALAILKIVHFNGNWAKIWNLPMAA